MKSRFYIAGPSNLIQNFEIASSLVSQKYLSKIYLSAVACYLFVIPAKAGIHATLIWTPACAGVTIILQLACGTRHSVVSPV